MWAYIGLYIGDGGVTGLYTGASFIWGFILQCVHRIIYGGGVYRIIYY